MQISLKVGLHPLATHDLNTATNDYKKNATRTIASNFLMEFRRSVALIGQFPKLATKADGVFRRLPLNRYPYTLIYLVEVNEVRIMAVAHDRSAPDYWHDRV
jgi:toxin ParE1/3/4